MRVSGKTALITGAGAGIGRASVLLFAREGARVAAVDVNEGAGSETARLACDQGGDAIFHQADVSRAADAEGMIQAAIDRFGRLDILFNNAGIVPGGTAEVVDEETWDSTMAVDLRSVFLACKYAIPVMRGQGGAGSGRAACVAGP